MRGFTLIELMVVVLVIAVTAAIALPGIVNRMRSNRTKMAAEHIAIMFRQGRLRAVARSSAVLVRYNGGVISIHEGIQGNTAVAGCETRPETSCTIPATRWANTDRSQEVDRQNFTVGGEFSLVVTDQAGNKPTLVEACFTPSGRALIRDVAADPFAPWLSPLRIDVDRADDVGFQRTVLVAPTGSAKVVASP